MKTISNNVSNEIIIEHSRFICELFKIQGENEVELYLEKVKKEYKDATHYCYAYITNSHQKCSDNGEPSGTAGLPILNVLKQNDLTQILCIVIRYFGGIKLGAGGLVRAYTKSVTSALSNTNVIDIVSYKKIKITFSYENTKNIDYLLKNFKITNKLFNENIIYEAVIPTDLESKLHNEIASYIIEYKVINQINL